MRGRANLLVWSRGRLFVSRLVQGVRRVRCGQSPAGGTAVPINLTTVFKQYLSCAELKALRSDDVLIIECLSFWLFLLHVLS